MGILVVNLKNRQVRALKWMSESCYKWHILHTDHMSITNPQYRQSFIAFVGFKINILNQMLKTAGNDSNGPN